MQRLQKRLKLAEAVEELPIWDSLSVFFLKLLKGNFFSPFFVGIYFLIIL